MRQRHTGKPLSPFYLLSCTASVKILPAVPFFSSRALFFKGRRFIETKHPAERPTFESGQGREPFHFDLGVIMSEAILAPTANIGRPEPGEYAPYYDRYISLISGNDILGELESQRRRTLLLLSGRSEDDGDFRYAPDKWSAKEVLGHVCDTERIFAYRALRISRGDRTPLASFEQDDYIRDGPFAARPLCELIDDYIAVRRATLTLFRNLDEQAWLRRGTASDKEVSVRALAYMIAGHEQHHRRILEEKYFGKH